MKIVTFLCWVASLIVLAALLSAGFGLELTGWSAALVEAYLSVQGMVVAHPGWLAALVFYLLFGVVERTVSEWGFAYAGLVQRGTGKTLRKLGRGLRAGLGVIAWPLSLASDLIAVLLWHRRTGKLAQEAAALTLRSMRYGLSRDEVDDVVSRYGRLTYMARPLFMTALCLSYVVVMLVLFLSY